VFRLGEYQGTRTIDIRKYFFDKSSLTYHPTKTGITFTESSYLTLTKILNQNSEEILDWLSRGASSNGALQEVKENQKNQEMSKTNARYSANDYKRKEEFWKDQKFFETEASGGEDVLSYNVSHDFWINLQMLIHKTFDKERNESIDSALTEILLLFDMLLISFSKATDLVERKPIEDPESLIDTLYFNWGAMLKEYLKKKAHNDLEKP